jgi:hypothetical protein
MQTLSEQLNYLNKNTTGGHYSFRGNPVLVRGNDNHPDRLLVGIELRSGTNFMNDVLREFIDYNDENATERLDSILDQHQYNLIAWES